MAFDQRGCFNSSSFLSFSFKTSHPTPLFRHLLDSLVGKSLSFSWPPTSFGSNLLFFKKLSIENFKFFTGRERDAGVAVGVGGRDGRGGVRGKKAPDLFSAKYLFAKLSTSDANCCRRVPLAASATSEAATLPTGGKNRFLISLNRCFGANFVCSNDLPDKISSLAPPSA